MRELENAIERAVIIASGRQIELEDLPEAISKIALQERDRIKVERAKAASEGRTTTFEVTVPSSMEEIERQAIEATLDYTEGDKTHAARALGIGRKTLYRKLEQYNGQDREIGDCADCRIARIFGDLRRSPRSARHLRLHWQFASRAFVIVQRRNIPS